MLYFRNGLKSCDIVYANIFFSEVFGKSKLVLVRENLIMEALYHQMFHLKDWVVYWEMLNRLLIDVIKRFGYLVEMK